MYSYNINGLKSCIDKGFMDYFLSTNADFFCLQETKSQDPLPNLPGYYQYWNFCSRKGYSGTAVLTKHKPISVSYDIDDTSFDIEGRIITLEYNSFYLINIYAPNSQMGISRKNYRMQWDESLYDYLINLNNIKPVIICGDFNVALTDLDVCTSIPDESKFVDDERIEFENLLNSGFIDSFRFLHPNVENCFTWWNVGKDSKDNNIGWRLDYFLVSDYLKSSIVDADILQDISCSDHCPICLKIDFQKEDL
jgi:exodeoxyribonuclease-3